MANQNILEIDLDQETQEKLESLLKNALEADLFENDLDYVQHMVEFKINEKYHEVKNESKTN